MNPIALGAALAAGGALAGAALELAARARLRRRGEYFVLRPWSRVEMRVAPEFLPQLEEIARTEINRDGERGPPPPRAWDDTYRVLVAGGSAAECSLLDQASTWPAVAGSLLEPRRLGAGAVHVGNVSRSLVTCEHLESMLRRILPRYPRLDVVVLMVGGSDVVAWLEKRTPPAIEEGRVSTGHVFDEHPEGPYAWTPTGLALRRLSPRWYRRLLRPVERVEKAGSAVLRKRAMRARALEMLDEVPDPAPMLDHFERWLRPLIEAARTHAGRVLVVRQPWLVRDFTPQEEGLLWNFGAGRTSVEEVTAYYSHRVVNRLMAAVGDAGARVAGELGVEKLDVMERLDHDFETFYDRLHFTPKGARVVGAAVARAIQG